MTDILFQRNQILLTIDDNTNITVTQDEDNDEQKTQYDKLPKLNIKSSNKTSKEFSP